MKHNKLYNLYRVRYGFNQNEENQKVFHGKEKKFFFKKNKLLLLAPHLLVYDVYLVYFCYLV